MPEVELTDAQRQALLARHGKLIDVVDPATQQRYVIMAREQYEGLRALLTIDPEQGYSPPGPKHYVIVGREQYESLRGLLAAGPEQGPSTPEPPVASSPGIEGPVRVRLRDLPTPPDVLEETERWCKRCDLQGNTRRGEVEEQFKLQYYFGGQAAYIEDTPDGPIVIPITERYKDTPGLRYVLLTPEERPHACLTVPPRWRDADSEILS